MLAFGRTLIYVVEIEIEIEEAHRDDQCCSIRLTHIYSHTNIIVFTNSVYMATTTTSYAMLTTKRQTDRLTMAVKCYMHTRG